LDLPPRIVLYDGVCGLCNKSVQWIVAHDPDGVLRYATLQGEIAARLRARHPEIPEELSTVVFVEDGRVHLRSRAFMHIAKHLRGATAGLCAVTRYFVPAFIADLAYRVVAALRYRIWGKYDTCRIPSPEERARFLD
jgi:predicted DCC family thiol-disulfide oxidoreductase YuxK